MALEREVQASDGSEVRMWRSKPKLHFLAHILDLVELGNHPKDSWNYRDETFAGSLQTLSFRRGGKFKPGNASEKVLLMWMSATPFLHVQQPSNSKVRI